MRSSTNGPCAAFEPSTEPTLRTKTSPAPGSRLRPTPAFGKVITCKTRSYFLVFRTRDFYECRDYYSHFKHEYGAVLSETHSNIRNEFSQRLISGSKNRSGAVQPIATQGSAIWLKSTCLRAG